VLSLRGREVLCDSDWTVYGSDPSRDIRPPTISGSMIGQGRCPDPLQGACRISHHQTRSTPARRPSSVHLTAFRRLISAIDRRLPYIKTATSCRYRSKRQRGSRLGPRCTSSASLTLISSCFQDVKPFEPPVTRRLGAIVYISFAVPALGSAKCNLSSS
jgi:hypothetical protein